MPTHNAIQIALEPHFGKLESLLRLLTPDHPLQPMLGESISLRHCQSIIFEECHHVAEIGEQRLSGYEAPAGFSQTTKIDECRKSLTALAMFANEHLTAAYFSVSPEDLPRGTSADEFIRADFLDTDEFFRDDRLWNLRPHVWEHRQTLEDRIEEAEILWEEINGNLKTVLLEPLNGCSQAAYDAAATLPQSAAEFADILHRLPHGPYLTNQATARDPSRRHVVESITNAKHGMTTEVEKVLSEITKTLDEITKQLLPLPQEKDRKDSNRSRRQQIKKQITGAITTWLLRSRIIRAWHLLKQEAQRTIELQILLQNCRSSVAALENQTSKAHYRSTKIHGLTYASLLQNLKPLPLKVIAPKTLNLWERRLQEKPELSNWIAKALDLHCKGFSAFGTNALRDSLYKEASEADLEKRTKETQRKLYDLAGAQFAMHGSQNWIPFKDDKTRNLTQDQGWGINPLVVLLEPVKLLLPTTN
jgi:hypothetical protein